MKKYTAEDIEDQIKVIESKINDPELCKGTSFTYARILDITVQSYTGIRVKSVK
jgi:hypothetical protein